MKKLKSVLRVALLGVMGLLVASIALYLTGSSPHPLDLFGGVMAFSGIACFMLLMFVVGTPLGWIGIPVLLYQLNKRKKEAPLKLARQRSPRLEARLWALEELSPSTRYNPQRIREMSTQVFYALRDPRPEQRHHAIGAMISPRLLSQAGSLPMTGGTLGEILFVDVHESPGQIVMLLHAQGAAHAQPSLRGIGAGFPKLVWLQFSWENGWKLSAVELDSGGAWRLAERPYEDAAELLEERYAQGEISLEQMDEQVGELLERRQTRQSG